MSLIDQVRLRLAHGERPATIRAGLQAAGVSPEILELVASQVPELFAAEPPAADTPYARAVALKERGLTDAEILTALEASGLSADDARFVLRSLPDGELGDTRRGPDGGAEAESVMGVGAQLLDGLTGVPLGALYDGYKILK